MNVVEREQVGEKLPKGWKWARLGDICEINPTRPRGLVRDDDAPTTFVPMPSVDARLGAITNPEIRPFAEVRKGYTYFEENDVLFAKISPCMENGKHSIACNLIDSFGFGTTEFHVLRASSLAVPDWIYQFLRQPRILKSATEHFSGSVGQRRLPTEYLSNLEISLPPLPEQKRIVTILTDRLSTIDKARTATETQLKAAKALPAAYLRQVFGSPEAQKWKKKRLGDVCEIQLGKMLSPASKTGIRSRPYLRNANVQWGYVNISDVFEMDFTEEEEEKFRLKLGDLLVCEGGEPGRSAVWNYAFEPCYYQKALHRLRPLKNDIDTFFIMYRLWYSASNGEFIDSQAQTTIAHLPVVRLRELQIGIPQIQKQKQFNQFISEKFQAVENLVQSLQSQLNTINKLPAALLRQAFNGEL